MNEVREKAQLIQQLGEKVQIIAEQKQIIARLLQSNRMLQDANESLRCSMLSQQQAFQDQLKAKNELIQQQQERFIKRGQRQHNSVSLQAQFETKLKKVQSGERLLASSVNKKQDSDDKCAQAPNQSLISKFSGLSPQEIQKTLLSSRLSRELIEQVLRPLMHANSSVKEMSLTISFLQSSFQVQRLVLKHSDDCICQHYASALDCALSADFVDNLALEPEVFQICDGMTAILAKNGVTAAQVVKMVDQTADSAENGCRMYYYARLLRELGENCIPAFLVQALGRQVDCDSDEVKSLAKSLLSLVAEFEQIEPGEDAKRLGGLIASVLRRTDDSALVQQALAALQSASRGVPALLQDQLLINGMQGVLPRVESEAVVQLADLLYSSVFLQAPQGVRYSGVLQALFARLCGDVHAPDAVEKAVRITIQLQIRQLFHHAAVCLLSSVAAGGQHDVSQLFRLVSYQGNSQPPRDALMFGPAGEKARVIAPAFDYQLIFRLLGLSYAFSTQTPSDQFSHIICEVSCADEALARQMSLLLKCEQFEQQTLDFFVGALVLCVWRREKQSTQDCMDYVLANYQHLQVSQLCDAIYAILAAADGDFEYYEVMAGRVIDLCRFVRIQRPEVVQAVVRSRLVARKGCAQILRQKVLHYLVEQ